MADLSDLESALAALVDAACYPGGPGTACAIPGVAEVNVFRGWPDAASENAQLPQGVVAVTVYSLPGMTRNVTKYAATWEVLSPANPTLTVAVAGPTATWGGSGGGGQLAGVRVGGQRGQAYVYRLAPSDSPADVAAGLAALMPGATASGAVLTAPTVDMVARVSAPATMQREVRRQVQGVRVTLWCPTPQARDDTARVVDAYLGGFDGEFIGLPDGSYALLKYVGTFEDDEGQKAGLYRRDLRYTVEYSTLQTMAAPCVLFGVQISEILGFPTDQAPDGAVINTLIQ